MIPREQVPNALTVLRLVMSVVFFASLSVAGRDGAALIVAAVLFAIAAATDALDGYLARRWRVESAFGRVMDPLCDKVLVLGAFVYLAGPAFTEVIAPDGGETGPRQAAQLTGVYPWMVVVMLLREFLVTGLRGMVESAGVKFGANWFGKAKMILQSVGVPILLVVVVVGDRHETAWLTWARDAVVYAIVLATALSGVPYVTGAVKAMRGGAGSGEREAS